MNQIAELLNYLIITNNLTEEESNELLIEAKEFVYFLASNKACK